MAGWSASGVFTRLYSWIADAAAGIDISSIRTDADTDLIVTQGFGNVLTRDGQGSARANLPMNGFRHTGIGNGQAVTDYASVGQLLTPGMPTSSIGALGSIPAGAYLGEIKTTSLPEALIATLMPGWHICSGGTRARTDPLWLATGAIGGGNWAYGNGDGTTTYTLPDQRGRVAFGKDNMGGTAANRITSAISGFAGSTLGAVGGDQRAQGDTITTTLGGSVTANSSSSSIVTDPTHVHFVGTIIDNSFGTSGYTLFGSGGGVGIDTVSTAASATGVTVATTTTTTITDTKTAASSSGLTGNAQNIPPALIVNYVIFCGA